MICLSLFFFVLFVILVLKTDNPHCFLPFIVCFLLSICSIFFHFSDISTIRMGEDYIKIQQEDLNELNVQIKDLSILLPSASLMNQDSPYRSLIELKGERIKQLTDTKRKIIDAKKSLMQRKMGFNRDVVWFFGDK